MGVIKFWIFKSHKTQILKQISDSLDIWQAKASFIALISGFGQKYQS